jgi:hypothetical protein
MVTWRRLWPSLVTASAGIEQHSAEKPPTQLVSFFFSVCIFILQTCNYYNDPTFLSTGSGDRVACALEYFTQWRERCKKLRGRLSKTMEKTNGAVRAG